MRSSVLNCGHTGVDWNGLGDCITCARNKVLDPVGDMFKSMGIDVIDCTPTQEDNKVEGENNDTTTK